MVEGGGFEQNGITYGNLCLVYDGVMVGTGTRICDGAHIQANCIIGKDCVIGESVLIESQCTIGDRTSIQAKSYITSRTTIGHDVFIAPGVMTSNDPVMALVGSKAEREKFRLGPIIHDGVHIGVGAILLPGVSIGEGAVIGAGSLVTKDVGPGEYWKGSPAKYQGPVSSLIQRLLRKFELVKLA